MKNIANPQNTKELLKIYELRAIKRFGQNFLINQELINTIIKKADIDEKTGVLEIGPGLGGMTEKLCQIAQKVVAVELDLKLVSLLKKEIEHKNFEVISNDILKQDLQVIRNKFKDCQKIYVVANLPYNISSKIIIKLLPEKWINKIVVMLQKELAERLQAKTGDRNYNNFTVITNLFTDKKIILSISKNNFSPPPEVDSAILEMVRKPEVMINYQEFDSFIKKCFQQNRKKLTNNLKSTIDKNELINYLNQLGFTSDVRPDKLSTQQYIELFNKIKN